MQPLHQTKMLPSAIELMDEADLQAFGEFQQHLNSPIGAHVLPGRARARNWPRAENKLCAERTQFSESYVLATSTKGQVASRVASQVA